MDEAQYRLMNSDIQFYDRPATGYQVILLTPRNGRYWTLSKIYEYEDGSPYSYPAPSEATARQMAVDYAITAITTHWDRSAGVEGNSTRMDVRIYPFGGLIRDMRLVPRKPLKGR